MQALIPEARFYLSPDEVSILTGISKSQLEVWRRRGDGPKFIRIGKLVKCKRCVAPTLTDQAGIFAWAQGIRSSMRD